MGRANESFGSDEVGQMHRAEAACGDRTATAAAESTIGFDFPWLKETKKSPRTDDQLSSRAYDTLNYLQSRRL